MAVLVLVGSFLVLMMLGVPIAFCIALATMSSMLVNIELMPAASTVAQRIATGLDSFTLLAIPFFVLAGVLMGRGGIARRLIEFARALVGFLPGGLAFVNVIASMLFGAISGSAVAATVAIGSVMHPKMIENKYAPGYSAAVNVTAATTGLIIPPSNVLIIYSLASGGVSIAALFIAGYVPGILLGLSLMVVAGVIAHRQGYGTTVRASLTEIVKRFADAALSLSLIVIIIGGIVGGIFTATEAAAIAVVYALFLSMVVYREVRPSDLPDALVDAAITTAVVMLLIGTSIALSWLLAYENIPQNIGSALVAVSDNKFVILMIINVLLLVVGTFMDMTPAILIFTPIFLPVVTQLGVHPIHFGIMMVFNLCIGLCTPPVGTVLFAGCGVARISISQIIRPILPFYAAMFVALLLVTYVPEITLMLPRLFGYQ
jgi:tripartite ATP-independent transporter DctM subunit